MKTLLVVAVCVVGCGPVRYEGAPTPGTQCARAGAVQCLTAGSVVRCESTCDGCLPTWRERQCEEECNSVIEGCTLRYVVGESCAMDGSLACVAAADGGASMAFYECSSGTVKSTPCPGGCDVNGAGLLCRR